MFKLVLIISVLLFGSVQQSTTAPDRAGLTGPLAAQKGIAATYQCVLFEPDGNTPSDATGYTYTFSITPAIGLAINNNQVTFVPGNGPYVLEATATGPGGSFSTSRRLNIMR